jgi:hypothetical protein
MLTNPIFSDQTSTKKSVVKRPIRAYKSSNGNPASIPEMKAPVFRLSHAANGVVHADKLTPYRGSEEEASFSLVNLPKPSCLGRI